MLFYTFEYNKYKMIEQNEADQDSVSIIYYIYINKKKKIENIISY